MSRFDNGPENTALKSSYIHKYGSHYTSNHVLHNRTNTTILQIPLLAQQYGRRANRCQIIASEKLVKKKCPNNEHRSPINDAKYFQMGQFLSGHQKRVGLVLLVHLFLH